MTNLCLDMIPRLTLSTISKAGGDMFFLIWLICKSCQDSDWIKQLGGQGATSNTYCTTVLDYKYYSIVSSVLPSLYLTVRQLCKQSLKNTCQTISAMRKAYWYIFADAIENRLQS